MIVFNQTKHKLILDYIEALEIGSKISVRRIAKALSVSEGTAYRAIKEARDLGFLSTAERKGTIRIEKQQRNQLHNLTFSDVVGIVDGRVLGGSKGLNKTLNKFVIGAMKQEAMMRYIDPGSLLIVGNRDKVHDCALEQGSGVLITGGFNATCETKELADRLELPLISSSHDTFTVASMINRAMYDRLIKRKIMLVEDMAVIHSTPNILKASSTVGEWRKLQEATGHSRFPIVDEWNRVVGMITSKDIVGTESEQTLDKKMTRNPLTVHLHTSITTAAHMMLWEGIELLPVVDANRKFLSVISRNDVLKAMQYIQNQPQSGETYEDLIWLGFSEERDEEGKFLYRGVISPQMTNRIGTVSEGILTILMTQASYCTLKAHKNADFVMDNHSVYYLRPLQLESEIEIRPTLIDVSRKFGKIDIEIWSAGNLVCKGLMTAQVINDI